VTLSRGVPLGGGALPLYPPPPIHPRQIPVYLVGRIGFGDDERLGLLEHGHHQSFDQVRIH